MHFSSQDFMQVRILDQLKDGSLTIEEAMDSLNCSARTVKRKLKRLAEGGYENLIHKNRGRISPRKINSELEVKAIELHKTVYSGAGPTFFSQLLARDHGIHINKETLRLWLKKRGLLVSRRRNRQYRSKRERKLYRGQMVQMDGSFHHWFGRKYPPCTLLVAVDDATSEILAMKFVKRETTMDVLRLLKELCEEHGLPVSIYTDRHSIYRVTFKPARERGQLTSYEAALTKLHIKPIHANSPQAKGRVERCFGTLQQRLVIELQIRKITTIEAANAYLPQYRAEHNARFAQQTALPDSRFRPASHINLNEAFVVDKARTLQNDYTFSLDKVTYQVHRDQPIRVTPKDRITIRHYLDGSTKLFKRDQVLSATRMETRPVARQTQTASRPTYPQRKPFIPQSSIIHEVRHAKRTKSNC